VNHAGGARTGASWIGASSGGREPLRGCARPGLVGPARLRALESAQHLEHARPRFRLAGADPLTGTVRVSLIAAAHRFGRGHRLRLQVAGGAHPRFARNPGNGQVDAPASEFEATSYAIGLSAEDPSALLLPVAP